MSLIILHGEHHVESRNALQRLIDQSATRDVITQWQDAKSLQLADLEIIFGSQELFGQKKLLIIERLHSLPRSNRKTELIALIAKSANSQNEIVLWEKKLLTATQLKQFPSAKNQLFKLSSALFAWLDLFGSLGSRQFDKFIEAIAADGKEFCFLMLARQIRYLIAAKSGSPLPGAPFIQQKLSKQASLFSQKQLFDIHQKLTFLDYSVKTGQVINLVHELEKLMLYSRS
jgi:hypothetical protein